MDEPDNPQWLNRLQKIKAAACAGDEPRLHEIVHRVLTDTAADFEHEYTFQAGDRIDFMVRHRAGVWGIECKVSAPNDDVWRQLNRYAHHCDYLILLTVKPVARVITPTEWNARCLGLYIFELWKNF